MEVVVSTRDLKNAVTAAALAADISGKPQTPILSNLLLRTDENSLTITGTDDRNAIIVKIPAEVEKSGDSVVNAKILSQIVKVLTGGVSTLETNENITTVKSDATKYDLPIVAEADDFPDFYSGETEGTFEISSKDLKQLIKKSTFAASKDITRPIFKGVHWNLKSQIVFAVATNTHRLVKVQSELLEPVKQEADLIIPAELLNKIASILPEEEKLVKAEFNNRYILFKFENVQVSSRLIDGNFPPEEKVFPREERVKITMAVGALKAALERVNLIAREIQYNTVHLKFDEEGAEITANSYATGKASENLNAEVEGKIEIAFNINYLLDYLKNCDNDATLKIVCNEPLTPALFTTNLDSDVRYVITPVRV